MIDWTTVSALATGLGTLVLAVATFAAVRSANRAARAAELSLLAGLRPLLVPSRLEDGPQKVFFGDGKHVVIPGGGAAAEDDDGIVYLAVSVRNAGSGIGVLHGWLFHPGDHRSDDHDDLARFTRRPGTSTSRPGTPASGRARSVIRPIPGTRRPWRRSRAGTR